MKAGFVGRTQVGTGRTGNFAIRRPRSSDCEPIREFLTGLSPRARYLRFFSGAPPTSGAMLRILTGGSPRTDVLVASTGDGMIIGHAMAGHRAGPGAWVPRWCASWLTGPIVAASPPWSWKFWPRTGKYSR